MDTKELLASLEQFTGNLKPRNATERQQLNALQQTLTELLLSHPALSVTQELNIAQDPQFPTGYIGC